MSAVTRRVFGVTVIALLLVGAPRVQADNQADNIDVRVKDLTRVLTKSKKEKQRISAAIALGRLNDKRATRPLVVALRTDASSLVRSVAASALGSLGDERAVPALRKSFDDSDASVRKRAREAVALIGGKGSNARQGRRAIAASQSVAARPGRYQLSARERPRLSRPAVAPTMLVSIASVTDKSKGAVSKKWRQWRTDELRKHVVAALNNTPEIRVSDTGAARPGGTLPAFSVDVTIETLDRRTRGRWVELECKLRLSVSNERGRMMSVMTGGATVQVPRRTFRKSHVTRMYQDALENAALGVHQDLVGYLSRQALN